MDMLWFDILSEKLKRLPLVPPPTYPADDTAKFAIGTPDGGGRCLVCTKTFKSLKITRRHLKIVHTEDDPYECTVCGRVINNIYAFRTHMNLKHGCKGVSDLTAKYGRRLRDEDQTMHGSVDPPTLQDY